MATPQERKFAFSYVERGKQFVAAKQYPEALEALREAVRRDPTTVDAWILLATAHYRLGEDIECLGATEEALKLDPGSGAAWNFRGLALERLQREEEALDTYARAMRIDGWYLMAGRNAFRVLLESERYAEALRIADTLLEDQKDNSLYWAMRSVALSGAKRYGEAYEAASQAVQYNPDHGYAWHALALALRDIRQYSAALEASQRCVDLDPESSTAWNMMGLALLNLGRPAEAYKRFIRAAKFSTQSPRYPSNAGVALAHLRQYEQAQVWTDQALALRPGHLSSTINRVDDLVSLERYEEAEAQLKAVTEVALGHSGYWAAKGSLHTHRGEYDEALVAIKRAIDLDEDDSSNAFAYGCMGELLIALAVYPQALEFAEHGLELRPHDFCLQELKGKALRGLGRETEAEEIERAVQARIAEQLALLDQAGFMDE
jgi:tetratricopeptide (TPR) repeat protein